MSAYLYYHCDTQVWNDNQYDAAANTIANQWTSVPLRYKVLLDPDMQNDPAAVTATGHHFLYTKAIIQAAKAWWLLTNRDWQALNINSDSLLSGEEVKRREFVYEMKHGRAKI